MGQKPGIKTTEFWVTLLVVAGAIAIAILEVVRDKLDSVGALAVIGGALAAVGYTHSRSSTKRDAHAKAHAAESTKNGSAS